MTQDGQRSVRAPEKIFTLLESRAAFELGAFFAASPMLRMLGRGDSHPVLVLPGFTGNDRSTMPLRWWLRSQGYWSHGWQLGANIGPSERIVHGMRDRLDQLTSRHDRKVTLVGWSLGGIYARLLAREAPEQVRQVITLGSPFRMQDGDASAVNDLWEQLQHLHSDEFKLLTRNEQDRGPVPVPTTAIYTRTDGVVRWNMCIEAKTETSESIEVYGSHSGLGHNPTVIVAVADRLAQPEDDWKPFKTPKTLAGMYPRAVHWDAERDSHLIGTV